MKMQKYPICEVCGKHPATSFSWFQNYSDERALTGEWKFACGCTSGIETYYIEFERFFQGPEETADWLAHLSQKKWFDYKDFARMMRRFQNASGQRRAA